MHSSVLFNQLHQHNFAAMFYSEVILARKGPLGKIWLAAHFDKKLTKKQIFSTDISSSVESVLNPANPLALRVSGHLMLGIVRIYSRKMKYLVTDCADAMWKIDLAFRPKNVDIDPTIAQIIDDARHFGNVSIDNEFPELENTAFPQDLLTGYDYPRLDMGRFSDISYGQDGDINEYSMSAESPLYTRKSGPTGSSSRRSVASDIEATRFVGSQQRLSGGRTSLLSASAMRASLGSSVGAGVDDDIPAYTDDYGGYGGDYGGYGEVYPDQSGMGGQLLEFGGTQDQLGDEPPPFDTEYYPEEEMKATGDGGGEQALEAGETGEAGAKAKSSRESLRVQQKARAEAALRQRQAEAEAEDEEEGEEDEEAQKLRGSKDAAAQGRRKKKKRVMIDDRVELPSRLIKQRRTDLAPILRQRGTDALQQAADPESYAATRAQRNHLLRTSPLGHRAHLPAGVRGMCAELQEVFGMSINAAPLPFPLKEGAVASAQPQIERSSPQVEDEIVEEPEGTREPRNSELSVAGRTSLLSSQGAGLFSASKSANASFAGDGAGTEGGYTYEGGDWGGYEEQPSGSGDHGQQLMDFGPDNSYEAGAEEVKRGDSLERGYSAGARHDLQPPRPVQPRNAVSELVASTFAKGGGSELDSRSAGEVSGGSKSSSSSSASRHTRTEQFMGILEDEFRSAEEDAVVSFDTLSAGVSKRVAAACFLEVLQLKTWGRIQATQQEPFDDILLRPAPAGSSSSRVMAGSM